MPHTAHMPLRGNAIQHSFFQGHTISALHHHHLQYVKWCWLSADLTVPRRQVVHWLYTYLRSLLLACSMETAWCVWWSWLVIFGIPKLSSQRGCGCVSRVMIWRPLLFSIYALDCGGGSGGQVVFTDWHLISMWPILIDLVLKSNGGNWVNEP